MSLHFEHKEITGSVRDMGFVIEGGTGPVRGRFRHDTYRTSRTVIFGSSLSEVADLMRDHVDRMTGLELERALASQDMVDEHGNGVLDMPAYAALQ